MKQLVLIVVMWRIELRIIPLAKCMSIANIVITVIVNIETGGSMKLFKIYTENKNYNAIVAILKTACFDGFTITKAEGHFGSDVEHSLVIDIVTDDWQAVESVAYTIKKTNKQHSVLVVRFLCDIRLSV